MAEEDIMITLTFLGVGSAFAKRNFNSNFLLEVFEEKDELYPSDLMLVDFGLTGPVALHELSKVKGRKLRSPNGLLFGPSIPKVLVTHQHSDHAAGLAEMALANYFVHDYRPKLYGKTGVLGAVWDCSLKAGCDTLPREEEATLEDFFEVCPVKVGEEIKVGRYDISLFKADHIRRSKAFDWPCYGIQVFCCGKTAYISGDSRLYPARIEAMGRSEIIFHDCSTCQIEESPHASLRDLAELPRKIKEKMYLYHYEDNFDDESLRWFASGFSGYAQAGFKYKLLD